MKNKKKLLILMPFLLIIFLGISYAAFTYVNSLGNNEFIMGDLRFNYYDVSPNIKKTKVTPETKEEARDPLLHPTQSIMIDDYEYDYQDNELLFKVDCVSPLDDFYYSIGVSEGDAIEGKTRLDPKFIRLDFYEIDPSTHEETTILEEYSLYNNCLDEVLKVDQISTEEVRLYRIRFWYDDSVVISNSVPEADYTATEFSNGYYSVKMHIDASFDQHYYDYSYMRRYSSTEFWPDSINNIKNSVKNISFLKLTDQLLNEYSSSSLTYDATDYNYPNTKQIYVYTKNNNQDLVIASESLIIFPTDANHALAGFGPDSNSSLSSQNKLRINITNLNTSKSQDMSYFFFDTCELEEIIHDENNYISTESATNLSHFISSTSFPSNKPIHMSNNLINYLVSNMDTKNVTNFSYFITNCTNLTDLDVSMLDVSNGRDFSHMFRENSNVTRINIDGWDTSKATAMNSFYNGCSKLVDSNYKILNVSNVTTLEWFFAFVNFETIDITSWNTQKVTNFSYMFSNCQNLKYINMAYLDLSKTTTLNSTFSLLPKLEKINLSNVDTSNVYDFGNMFNGCSNIKQLDLSSFTVKRNSRASSPSIPNMFNGCTKLETIYVSEKWEQFDSSTSVFDGCTNLVGAVAWSSGNISSSYANYTTGYLTLKKGNALKSIQDYNFDLKSIKQLEVVKNKVINSKYLLGNLSNDARLYLVNDKAYIVVSEVAKMPEDSSYYFANLPNLVTITGLNLLDFSDVKNLSHLYDGDTKLLNGDSKNIITDKVTDASYMFNNCKNLKEINLMGLQLFDDPNNNDNINYMFADCINLEKIYAIDFDSSRASSSIDNYLYALKNCTKLINPNNTTETLASKIANNDYTNLNTLRILSYNLDGGYFSDTSVIKNIYSKFLTSPVDTTVYEDWYYSQSDYGDQYDGMYQHLENDLDSNDQIEVEHKMLFYRGKNTSETVIFNNKCWKVLSYTFDKYPKTNLKNAYQKLIYFGEPVLKSGKLTCPDSNKKGGKSVIHENGEPKSIYFSSGYTANYVNYMIGSSDDTLEHAFDDSNESNITNVLNNWYESEGFAQYEYWIFDAPYCSDRRMYEYVDDDYIYYQAYRRYESNYTATITCQTTDKYTVLANYGNGKLKHPIALITADELILSGYSTSYYYDYEESFYTYADSYNYFFTMTPCYYYFDYGSDSIYWYVMYETYIYYFETSYDSLYVRPVISLDLSRLFYGQGNGTAEDPYIYDMSEEKGVNFNF